MPDLTDLLSDEVAHQTPTHVRPFTELLAQRRHRKRRNALLGSTLGILIVATAVAFATAGQSKPTTQLATDSTATPGPFTRCVPANLNLTLTWATADRGTLAGTLTATNPTAKACELLLKPQIYPMTASGQRANVQFTVTMEAKGGPNALPAGDRATAHVVWGGWCEQTPMTHDVEVSWDNFAPATVQATGPLTPSCGDFGNSGPFSSSGWFDGLSEYSGPLTAITSAAKGCGPTDGPVLRVTLAGSPTGTLVVLDAHDRKLGSAPATSGTVEIPLSLTEARDATGKVQLQSPDGTVLEELPTSLRQSDAYRCG